MAKITNTEIAVFIDGRIRLIETMKITLPDYKTAIQIGIAQMVHEGKLELSTILANKPEA